MTVHIEQCHSSLHGASSDELIFCERYRSMRYFQNIWNVSPLVPQCSFSMAFGGHLCSMLRLCCHGLHFLHAGLCYCIVFAGYCLLHNIGGLVLEGKSWESGTHELHWDGQDSIFIV